MKAGPSLCFLGFRFDGGFVEKLLGLGAHVDASKGGPDSAGPVKALAGFSALDSGHELSVAFADGE